MQSADSPASDLPLLLTADECARQLSLARRTFDRYVASGVLPPADVRQGGKFIRWRRETLLAAVARLAGQLERA